METFIVFKVSLLYVCTIIMREKILNTSNELFLTLGFKSVTMDDIASKMGISKKTIYTYFTTKNDLVHDCVMDTFNQISEGIDLICEIGNDPIVQLFAIKNFVLNHLKSEKSSPLFQLKKYYPAFFYELQRKQFEVMEEYIHENLRKGIAINLFRKKLDVDFITRIYFSGITMIKDIELFPKGINNMKELQSDYLEYHIRAIATEKGLIILDNILKKEHE